MEINEKYRSLVEDSAIAAAACGVPGALLPGLDVAGIAGIWSNLLIGIARRSGRDLDVQSALKFATGVAGGLTGYIGGSKLFGFLLNFIPGGILLNIGLNGLLNYIFTKRFGRAVGNLFEKNRFSAADMADIGLIVTAIMGVPGLSEIREAVSSLTA